MRKFLCLTLLMAFALPGFTVFAQDTKKPKEVIGTKIDKSRGQSKYSLPTSDVEVPEPRKKNRGRCCVRFDNWTGYTVYMWIDNVFQGAIGPWKDGSFCVASGYTKWYAKTQGGTYEWSDEGECDGDFRMKKPK